MTVAAGTEQMAWDFCELFGCLGFFGVWVLPLVCWRRQLHSVPHGGWNRANGPLSLFQKRQVVLIPIHPSIWSEDLVCLRNTVIRKPGGCVE